VSAEGFNKGVNILHFLGGWTCEIVGERAISQTKMAINQRAPLEGTLVDVVCTGRFMISSKNAEAGGYGKAAADLRERPA